MATTSLTLPRDCYSVSQVCRLLRITRQALHGRRKRGTIAFVRFGGVGSYWFPRAFIDEMIRKANEEAHIP